MLLVAQYMEDRYRKATASAEKVGIVRALKVGVANGSMLGSFLVVYMVITFF